MDSEAVKQADKREQENVNRFLNEHVHNDRFGDYLARKEPWRNEE